MENVTYGDGFYPLWGAESKINKPNTSKYMYDLRKKASAGIFWDDIR